MIGVDIQIKLLIKFDTVKNILIEYEVNSLSELSGVSFFKILNIKV